MTKVTMATGAALVALGAIAYVASSAVSVTALIPAFVGLPILIAGVVARNPAAHRHAIHAALAVALLGALGSLMQVAKIGDVIAGTAQRPAAVIVSTIMFALLAIYVGLGVRSFVAARRSRS